MSKLLDKGGKARRRQPFGQRLDAQDPPHLDPLGMPCHRQACLRQPTVVEEQRCQAGPLEVLSIQPLETPSLPLFLQALLGTSQELGQGPAAPAVEERIECGLATFRESLRKDRQGRSPDRMGMAVDQGNSVEIQLVPHQQLSHLMV
ncbi:MAG TPA: hypothetical protein VGO93_23305 [Candidatus Xenobia bacterium]